MKAAMQQQGPETALSRRLAMRVTGPAAAARKAKVSQAFQADLPGPAARAKTNRFAQNPNQS
jgi:hypothetical protein